MGAPRDYLGWDLVIRSELPIPGGWPLESDEARRPDISVMLGRAELDGPYAERPPYRFGDGGILFETPGAGRYLIAGDTIIVEPAADAAAADVADLLIATALPALLWLRGAFVLHAACVAGPEGSAFGFMGRSGIGKSLLAGHLIREGWNMVGDDSIVLGAGDDTVLASGLSACMYQRGGAERMSIAVPRSRRRRSAPLKGLLDLRPAEGAALRATRLGAMDSFAALLANRHRPAVPRGLRVEGKHLGRVARIADAAPVMTLDFDPGKVSAADLAGLLVKIGVAGPEAG